jgi:hypothetical protein
MRRSADFVFGINYFSLRKRAGNLAKWRRMSMAKASRSALYFRGDCQFVVVQELLFA